MCRATFKEVHPQRARRLRTELLQLQAGWTELQGKIRLACLQRQPQLRRQNGGLSGK
jgi:uncharacterized protein (DUF2132 family)